MKDVRLNEHRDGSSRHSDGSPGDTALPDVFDGGEEAEEKRYLDPSRWWLASTAFPLVAGTFGPMANAFNICALGQYWREDYSTDQDHGIYLKDPTWLLAANAVSLACGLTGNLSLLLNMTGKVSFRMAQPITVGGFSGASVVLIAIVAKASTDTSFHAHGVSDQTLSQAFYYAAYAAGIYLIVAILMIITILGALSKKYDERFNITPEQRTLMLQTIVFLGYLMIGALIYRSVEGWDYLDAVYWANFTLLTVGLGSPFVPETHTGRSLLFVYAIGGIVALGLVISSIRSMVIEQGKQKLLARYIEKRREQVSTNAQRSVQANGEAWRKMDPQEIRRLEFTAMRQIQQEVFSMGKWRALAFSLLSTSTLWLIGALVFMYTEHEQNWTYFEAVYFAFVVLTTIGYGDFAPTSNSGKVFFVFWTLLAVPTLTIFISDMGDTVAKALDAATNFLGFITILPGNGNPWQSVTAMRNKKPPSAIRRIVSQDPGKIPDSFVRDAESSGADRPSGRDQDVRRVLKARLSIEERADCLQLRNSIHLDVGAKDRRFLHWLLAHEVTKVHDDVERNKEKQYTYSEWTYFLALLGHDEQSAHSLNQPFPLKQPRRSPTGYELGKIVDKHGNIRNWSWLGIRSPLMSARTESEWILHQLMAKLRRDLHPQRSLSVSSQLESPAVTLAHLE